MMRELFAAAMLFAEPLLFAGAAGFFVAQAFAKGKVQKKRKQVAWGLLWAGIGQAILVVLAAFLLPLWGVV